MVRSRQKRDADAARSRWRQVAAVAATAFTLVSSTPAAQTPRAKRLATNPLITVRSSPTLGGNVNGPTVLRVPPWIEWPLGRYYMYFANHMGESIRLAYADDVSGPWKVYEPGVLHVRDTAFYRPPPDPPGALADFYTHVASPEILVDNANKRMVMWVHGWWTNGERWPDALADARSWARQKGYSQSTQAAETKDGLHFTVHSPITRHSYLRVFEYGGYFYSVSRLGQLARSKDPLAAFEAGPNPFRNTTYANRIRHVALSLSGSRLSVYFTAIADAPERVMLSTVDLRGDWAAWLASPPVEILRPEMPYECVDLPVAPSEPGDIDAPVRQIRDPFVFEENGRTFLFYAICGEQGIAAATLER